ncbi:DUF2637 domain-containing protein [Frankia sp. AgB1.9]|uniref:DUF2637 domain-containing protein n=1 Tax=unclassified Frankia TaxID=2632575 RepID=UPI00193460C5|nr:MULTISPECIES: DUF2637 domain-containing protein [unclassified Frankia]MBL7492500.1 DUF2637 domain-containing protein [Frankia sp. AgW1.1]MBL7547575.1 DUF2637 domain-containing protein [Frankia sp. AgB1.9]MBL7619496.1 DUF2637 domain-containing protein [Frankia sp. AgB1.8]
MTTPTTRPRANKPTAAQGRPGEPTDVRPRIARPAAGPRVAAGPASARPSGTAATATTTDVSAVPLTSPRDAAVALSEASRTRGSRRGNGELWIRLATVAAVVTVALIAGIVSYRHMAGVAREHGEDRVTAAIVPISVDGLIVAASLTLLADSRAGRRRSPLPYALLALASTASIAANVMHAEPDLAARLIAAWPSAALIGSYEMLMSQIRKARHQPERAAGPRSPDPDSTRRSTLSGDRPNAAGHDDSQVGAEAHGANGLEHLDDRQRMEPTAVQHAGHPTASGSSLPAPAAQIENAAPLSAPDSDEPWPDGDAGWDAPEPIPPAVLTRALRTCRRGSKRARLAAVLLRDVAPDDPRTDYALARDLAPVIDLHAGTARRYLSEWRRQAIAAA